MGTLSLCTGPDSHELLFQLVLGMSVSSNSLTKYLLVFHGMTFLHFGSGDQLAIAPEKQYQIFDSEAGKAKIGKLRVQQVKS